MGEFLAPLNYRRAHAMLEKLSFYTSYDAEGALLVQSLLRENYPKIFERSEQKLFDNQALLLEMAGANATDPLVFVSHLDSLPCCPLTDNSAIMTAALQRAHVVALLEALEALLQSGYRPGGDLLIALSMDGLSGGKGAKSMATHMKARKILPCFVLDFGGYVTHSAFCTYLPPQAPLAMIGISEKGLLEGRVTAKTTQECRRPPLHSLLRGGARLTRRTRKAGLCKTSEQMLLSLSRHAPFWQRLLVLKPRLTFPLLKWLWRKRSVMNQFFLSELTLTDVRCAGEPAHAPTQAELRFCQTTLPGVSIAKRKRRLQARIANEDLRFETSVELEHSARSQTGGEAWTALETAIEILFERAVIVPCLSPYVTDGRFYTSLRGNVYRFSPFLLTGEEALRGECSLNDAALQTAVQFFRQMLSV